MPNAAAAAPISYSVDGEQYIAINTGARATGNQLALAFECGSHAEVDERYEQVTAAGFVGEKDPWDAFWGQRYAQLRDPAKRGQPIVLALKNETPVVQPFHLHGHVFRLLHPFDDGWEPYFLDTVQVPENRTVRIAFNA